MKLILFLTWSENCVISSTVGGRKFTIASKKLYVPVLPLSIQVNVKLEKQLKSGLNEQLTGKKISIKSVNRKKKTIFKFLSWSKFDFIV